MAALGCQSGSVWAQSATPPANKDCNAAASAPATPPASGANSGTAPGGMGSTGWTGGTGGSHVGTANDGPTKASPNAQPETAKGLDLKAPDTDAKSARAC